MIEVTTPYIKHTFTSGDLTAEYIQIDAVYFFARRNETTVFALPKDVFYLVENIYEVKDVLNTGLYIEANGMIVILDSNNQVKNVRTIVGNFEWFNGAWAIGTASGTQMKDLADKLADGDKMLLGRFAAGSVKGTLDGEAITANSRDVLAYVFMITWIQFPETVPSGATYGWRNTNPENFIDPSTVVFTLSTSQSV